MKNGLHSRAANLPSEDLEEYLAHSAASAADLSPEGPIQDSFARIISDNAWRLERLRGEIEKQSGRVSELLDFQSDHRSKLALAEQATANRILESLGRHE